MTSSIHFNLRPLKLKILSELSANQLQRKSLASSKRSIQIHLSWVEQLPLTLITLQTYSIWEGHPTVCLMHKLMLDSRNLETERRFQVPTFRMTMDIVLRCKIDSSNWPQWEPHKSLAIWCLEPNSKFNSQHSSSQEWEAETMENKQRLTCKQEQINSVPWHRTSPSMTSLASWLSQEATVNNEEIWHVWKHQTTD